MKNLAQRTLLTDAVLADAMRTVYADVYASYVERVGIDLNFSGCEITTTIDYRDGLDADLLPVGWDWVAKIERVWGRTIDQVFEAMGFTPGDDLGKHLWHLFAPCLGHGVSLADDHDDDVETAAKALGLDAEKIRHPIYLDGDSSVTEMAQNDLDAALNAGTLGIRSDSGHVYTIGEEIELDGADGKIVRFDPPDHESDAGYLVVKLNDGTESRVPVEEWN